MNEIKVYCGIGTAHSLMLKANTHIEAADPINLRCLLDWKENRSDMFNDPFTVGKIHIMKHISVVLSLWLSHFLHSFIKLFAELNQLVYPCLYGGRIYYYEIFKHIFSFSKYIARSLYLLTQHSLTK